jgi:hypothetical protein
MKKNEKLNINAVAMVRKIRDDNYKLLKHKSRKERMTWFRMCAKEANKMLECKQGKGTGAYSQL